jgi:hypothetical protein
MQLKNHFNPMAPLKNWLMLLVMALGVFACNPDDDGDEPSGPTDDQGRVILEGDISANRTLTANEKYLLRGFVYVTNDATLTIQPGTVIMGEKINCGYVDH